MTVMARAPDPSMVRIAGRWAHRDISANGIRLHVAELGDGPLVLLVHGFAGFWWTWRHQLTALADAGYRAVAVDLRGYGDSDKPPRGYDGWTLSGDIAGLIKALGERDAHLVGHAWGGLLGWTVAATHARHVRSLTVISAPHPLALRAAMWRTLLRGKENSQVRASWQVFVGQLPIWPERRWTREGALAVERYYHDGAGDAWRSSAEFGDVARVVRQAMTVPGVAHSALEYYRWALRSQLRSDGRRFAAEVDRRLTMPVLQLHGGRDPYLLERTASESTPWRGPRSKYVALQGIGHFPQLESPAVINTALVEFLASVS